MNDELEGNGRGLIIYHEGPRKATENLSGQPCPGRDSKRAPSNYNDSNPLNNIYASGTSFAVV